MTLDIVSPLASRNVTLNTVSHTMWHWILFSLTVWHEPVSPHTIWYWILFFFLIQCDTGCCFLSRSVILDTVSSHTMWHWIFFNFRHCVTLDTLSSHTMWHITALTPNNVVLGWFIPWMACQFSHNVTMASHFSHNIPLSDVSNTNTTMCPI